jgi:hypothetical protein
MSNFKTTPVLFNEVFVGMRVKDDEGNVGTITKCDNIHNISIEYDKTTKVNNINLKITSTGGYRFICLDLKCIKYEKIYKEINFNKK